MIIFTWRSHVNGEIREKVSEEAKMLTRIDWWNTHLSRSFLCGLAANAKMLMSKCKMNPK